MQKFNGGLLSQKPHTDKYMEVVTKVDLCVDTISHNQLQVVFKLT